MYNIIDQIRSVHLDMYVKEIKYGKAGGSEKTIYVVFVTN